MISLRQLLEFGACYDVRERGIAVTTIPIEQSLIKIVSSF